MEKIALWIFLGILIYGAANHSDKILNKVEGWSPSYSVDGHSCAGCGTTRCFKFQEDYERSVKEYDRKMMSLPPGLLLPGGETVQERLKRIESGDIRADK